MLEEKYTRLKKQGKLDKFMKKRKRQKNLKAVKKI